MGFLSILGGVAAARGIGSFIQKITTRIFPFEGSTEEARVLYQAKLNNQQQELNQEFQLKLREKDFQDKKELAYVQGMLARQTAFLSNIQNCQNTMRNKLFDDALRNFPLNIPPLVMLQNAGIPIGNLTDQVMDDDPFMQSIRESIGNIKKSDHFFDDFRQKMRANPVALSVFITPLQIDSSVIDKDKVSSAVWTNIYRQTESLFINEYNRGGERPVIFYPGAWNTNAKPGMHASEILYFFTKGMPVVVIEPRYDGKQIRFLFSCWGIGMTSDNHIRQEISFNLDWNELVLPAIYERSKTRLEIISTLEKMPSDLMVLKKRLEHNVSMYEALEKINGLKNNGVCEDPSKLFLLSGEDYDDVAKMLSCSLGMVLSALSDVHHMLSRGINPLFPEIKSKYFGDIFDRLNQTELATLNESFAKLFKSANAELFLNEPIENMDYQKKNDLIDKQFDSSDNYSTNGFELKNNGIVGMLNKNNEKHGEE